MASVVAFAVLWLERTPLSEPVALSQLDDAELEPRLRDLLSEGGGGLAVVVESLAAERTALRRAAFRTLHEEIDRGVKASADEAAVAFNKLGRTLARSAPHFKRESLALAAELAERLIALPPSVFGPDRDRLQDCHVVLAAQAQERMRNRDRFYLSGIATASTRTGHPARSFGETDNERPIDLAPLAGGGLPIVRAHSEPLRLPDQIVADARPLRDFERELHTRSKTAKRDIPVAGPLSHAAILPRTSIAHDAGTMVSLAEHTAPEHTAPAAGRAWPSSGPLAHQPEVAPPADLKRLLELETRVRAKDAAVANSAREEIMRAGVDERQLGLARGAVDSDPRVRKEVVEALSLIGSVDGRAWLLWFSHDHDAEVRRAAISLMATASDPELKKRVRQAAQSDADPRVRAEARAAAAVEAP